jgi:hypothetical protein
MSRIRFLLPLAGLWLASPVFATDLAYVKCSANQDRVWVYDSLSSFDVEAKLKCGEPVEILHRLKGYVKIRTESGVEGYVPDSVFPDLPTLPDDADKPAAASAAQRSLAAAAAATKSASTPTPSVAATKPAPVTVAAAKPAPTEPAAPQAAAITITPVAVPQPAAAPAPSVASAARAAPVKTSQSAKSTSAKSTTPSAPGHATTQAKVSTASAHTVPAPTVAKKVNPAPSTSSPDFDSAPAARLVHSAPVASPKASVETVSARRDSGTVVSATAQPVADAGESEDYPDTQVQNESADPSCRVFFAAYGLSPSQYKWMAENRRKEFSGICPAPDLAHVDYVVLFTHDSNSYTYAMPQPVHTDHNGFSDFSPLTTVDTALVKASDVEKARYEFVWVFRITRGAFDPAKFSPRRRPQFTTYVKGSRAPARAAEDAFNFVETQGATR